MAFVKFTFDSLDGVKVAESTFGVALGSIRDNVKSAYEITQSPVDVYTSAEALTKLIASLTGAQAQAQAFADAKASADAFRKGLETPVPVEPIEPPVVIVVPELPAPVEPTPEA